ncbi:MAG: phosphatase PAP2 family protein [Solirubrobacterales bacterium]|nr:phosphatase PAP2 family protein [Solirubrobacterales bacterium]
MHVPKEKRDRVRLGVIAAIVVAGFVAYQQLAPDINVEQILEDLSRELGDWTYVLVGVLAFLETGAFVGLVFPGETAVILGGAVAGQGETSIVITIAIVWFCAWAGDTTSFWIGTRLGRGFVLRHGPKVRITHERFEQVERYFARHGGKTILIGRFVGLVRALAPFIAGSSGMRYRAFVPFSVLGTGLWAAAFSLLGYALSQSLDKATEIAGTGALVFGTLVVIVVAVIVASRYLREPENRRKVARRIESTPGLRRLLPQLRFLWKRLTPGGLGLEFTTLLATLSVSLFVFVGYALVVSDDAGPTPGDSQAIDVSSSLRADWLIDFSKVFTELGSTPVTLAVAVAAGIVLARRRLWAEAAVLVAALVICHIAVPAFKELIDRPRPDGALIGTSGESYPSGHATYSVLYAWLALTIAIRARPGRTYGSALIAAGIALAALVGLSRVYLGAHYLSDVSGGWGLGVSAFAICAMIAMVVTHLRQNHTR